MSDWRFAQPVDGDETDLSKERSEGLDAKAILESPIFLKAVQAYRDELAREWLATKQEDVAARECLYQQSIFQAFFEDGPGLCVAPRCCSAFSRRV